MRIYFVSVIVCVLSTASHAQDRPLMDAGEPFGMLPLVDEVVVGQNEDAHGFVESEPGISEVQDILGASTRVIPNVGGARFIGYRMGAGMGLQSGKAYVLVVDYPEDGPRTNYIINRGGEYARGFSTGIAVGDSLQNYTQNNPESLDYPLSGGVESSKTLFFLHENFASQVLNLQGPMARPETPADGRRPSPRSAEDTRAAIEGAEVASTRADRSGRASALRFDRARGSFRSMPRDRPDAD